MTKKEIADRIRATLTVHSDPELVKLADELDPPRPEPGTVVWFPIDEECGVVADNGRGVYTSCGELVLWASLQEGTRPARIAGPMQETATIPPLDQWPEDAKYCEVAIVFDRHTNSRRVQHVIDRKEAERREAEG